MTRLVTPRRWNSLVLTTAALSLVPMADSAFAQINTQDAQIWTIADGGEGGEAGAVANATAEVAYLGQLGIVEGHMRAARDLYAKGQVDEAIGLSYHPEAEMMDAVRDTLIVHKVPDITPAMTAFSQKMEAGAPLAEVEQALATVQQAIAAAMVPVADATRVRFDAVVLLLSAAAHEYAGSIENGAVADNMAYHESYEFIATAKDWLTELASVNPKVAAKALAALDGASAAYGDMTATALTAGDPAILAGVAAQVELYVSQVR